MNKILVAKRKDSIIISQNGKKLIVNNDNELFEKLQPLDKQDIIKWLCDRTLT